MALIETAVDGDKPTPGNVLGVAHKLAIMEIIKTAWTYVAALWKLLNCTILKAFRQNITVETDSSLETVMLIYLKQMH